MSDNKTLFCIFVVDMNTTIIPYDSTIKSGSNLEDLHLLLDKAKRQPIDQSAWPNKDYIGNCEFAILYGENAIAIKYFVTEDEIRATYTRTNDPVYKDSCVEFFVSIDDVNYYNLEFNCNGTCLSQYGPNRSKRSFLPVNNIELIKTYKTLKHIQNPDENKTQLVHWELTILIPFSVFVHDKIESLKGKSLGMNFYKCGDDMLHPHYLSWNKVDTPSPDFHRPDFFGKGVFQ